MREHEYTPLIPAEELVIVKKLYKRAHKRRGWAMAVSDMDAAWVITLQRAASTLCSGANPDLALNFSVDQLTLELIAQLCTIIDEVFLQGLMNDTLKQVKQPLRVQLLDLAQDDWMTSIDLKGTLYVNKPKWRKDIHAANPMNFEGAVCSSRLEALLHALAHELVHLLVLLLMPEVNMSSPAYLPDDRHGPIFKLLNKKLFGHMSHHSHQLFRPRAD